MTNSVTLDTLILVTAIALLCMFVDLVTGVVAAILSHNFNATWVAEFLDSHVLKRVFPIVGAAGLAFALDLLLKQFPNDQLAGILQLGISGAWAASIAGVGTYALETLKSLQGNWSGLTNQNKGAPSGVIAAEPTAASSSPPPP